MLLYSREGNSTTAERHGWSYIWQRSYSHNVCMVNECLKFLVCIKYSLPQSKSNCKVLQVILLPAQAYDVTWRHRPSVMNRCYALLAGCKSGFNGPILILFVANCDWNLLDSYQAIINFECFVNFDRFGPVEGVVSKFWNYFY